MRMNHSGPFGRVPVRQPALDTLIQFGQQLMVDHPAIDAQHKAIFQVGVGAYEDWCAGGSLDVVRPAVDKLANLMHTHFTYEERVLDELGYDDLAGHQAEHRAMRDDLSMLHERFHSLAEIRADASVAPGDAIIQLILELTVGHVGTSDMLYCRALRGEAPDDFWRGANAVGHRSLGTGQPTAARSAARLEARLRRRAGGR